MGGLRGAGREARRAQVEALAGRAVRRSPQRRPRRPPSSCASAAQQFKEQQAQAAAANELLEVTVPPLRGADRPDVHAIDEMDEIPLALARRFVDTAFKPLDDWSDWDVIEQFQTAAVRYQVDHMIYTLALQKFTRTPAFRGYQDEAMRRLVEKYQQKKVWSYWAYENLWGNLEWNPDPARKQNIMLTGFFALSLGAFQTVTGDYRHQEVGSIEFVWSDKRRYPYSYDTLCASLTSDYLKSPWGLVVCEPNWIFSPCNMRGAAGLRMHDRLHGTHYWDMIKDGYYRGMEQEFVRPDGTLNFYRSARTGIGLASSGFATDLRPTLPHVADRAWTMLRAAYEERDGKLVTPLVGPRQAARHRQLRLPPAEGLRVHHRGGARGRRRRGGRRRVGGGPAADRHEDRRPRLARRRRRVDRRAPRDRALAQRAQERLARPDHPGHARRLGQTGRRSSPCPTRRSWSRARSRTARRSTRSSAPPTAAGASTSSCRSCGRTASTT